MAEQHSQRRRITLEDVAKLADVSTSAVSRTFTDGASVSKKTRTRVLKAANELGYRPNILARSLMTGRSALIALVSNAFENPYVMNILDVFTTELQARRLRPLVFNLSGSYNTREIVTLFSQYQVDGVLIASSTLDPSFGEVVAKADIPVVLAFGGTPVDSGPSAAFVDNFGGGRIAANAFLQRGYSRLAFLGGPEHTSTTQQRLLGFQAALAEAGAPAPQVRHAGGYSHHEGLTAATEVLRDTPNLDAIFCADDLIGMGTLDALRASGRSVPQTGVIGFNDIQMASWPPYRLSTIRAHTDQVVSCAIDMLESKINNHDQASEKRIISCKLVARESLRPRPPSSVEPDDSDRLT